jgi:hypothetical protein
MSNAFSLLLVGSISLIALSSSAIAQTPSAKSPSVKPASTQAPNVDGTWKVAVVGENFAPIITFVQKGNTLTGTLQGPMGDLPLTGTIANDKKIAFVAKFKTMSLKFAGIADGKMIKGTADLPRGRKNFTATRS